jgi:hypothetical protein
MMLTGIATALAASVLASPAGAQAPGLPDPQFAALATQLSMGDSLTVTDTAGEVVKGRLEALAPEQITLLVDGQRHTVAAARIARVQRKRVGVLLGAVIGAGVGIAAGAALASYADNEGGSQAAAWMFPIGIGLGTGIGIDALVNLPRTVYRRKPAAQVSVAPIIAPGAQGGSIRISF